MAEATTSRHESNYIKISMVVLRVSPRALRVQFDKEFHPHRLQNILNRNVIHLTNLKEKKLIAQPQWELLFPKRGEQPSSKNFDITLMICLLRNLLPIDIMDRLPSATDTSLSADLSRIRYYRNIIVHCDRALVDDTDFESYWNDITPAILRLGGNSLKEECDDLYGRNLDAEQRDDGLKRMQEDIAETEKKLIELEQEKRKELAEMNKKLIEFKQEQRNPVPKNIRDLKNVPLLDYGDVVAQRHLVPDFERQPGIRPVTKRMAEATISRHESNYIKIAMVVLRVSSRAVRVQFDKQFHPVHLQSILNRNVLHLTNLKERKRITQHQWNLLFPRTGQPSSENFDITLMICLLRNLIPIDIMDRLPSATDISLSADLSRIRYYRNIIAHRDRALVDDTDFESYWNDITTAFLRLGGNSFKVECDDWYGRNLNAEQSDDGLNCINAETRLALLEEELAEQCKKLAGQSKKSAEQSKELAGQIKELDEPDKELTEANKKLIELEQEKSTEFAETEKKLIELEQEHSKQLAETKKIWIDFEQKHSKELAEANKKLIELEQEKNPELAERKKKSIELKKKLAEKEMKRMIELQQEQSEQFAGKKKKIMIELEEKQSELSAETKKIMIALEQEKSEQLAEQHRKIMIALKKEQRKEFAEKKRKIMIELEQEQRKESAEMKKIWKEFEQKQSKESAEKNKKLIELEQEQSKQLAEKKMKIRIDIEQEQRKELAEMKKIWKEFEQEPSKESAETNKKLIELEQEQRNPVPTNIRELFYKLDLKCDNIDIHCIVDRRLERKYASLNSVYKHEQYGQHLIDDDPVTMTVNRLNQTTQSEFEQLYIMKSTVSDRTQLNLRHALVDASRQQLSILCRWLMANIHNRGVTNKEMESTLDIAFKNLDKDTAKAISWCIAKTFYKTFQVNLSHCFDVYPGLRCQCLNKGQNTNALCSNDKLIIITAGTEVKGLPAEYKGFKIKIMDVHDTSTEKSESETLSALLSQNYTDSYHRKGNISNSTAKKLFDSHSNLALICPSVHRSFSFARKHKVENELCIQLYCKLKGILPLGEIHFPDSIHGIPTDVIDGEARFSSILRIGDSIGQQTSTGTLGGFVRFLGDECFLTCAHVMYDVQTLFGSSSNCDAVKAYAHTPFGVIECGKVAWSTFDHSDKSRTSVDAALVCLKNSQMKPTDYTVDGDRCRSFSYLGLSSPYLNSSVLDRDDICTPQAIAKVVRWGAKTKLPPGENVTIPKQSDGDIVAGIANSDEYQPLLLHTPVHMQSTTGHLTYKRVFRMYNQFGIHLGLQPGDSGMCIYIVGNADKNGCIGMVIAGCGSMAVVTPLKDIFKRMGI